MLVHESDRCALRIGVTGHRPARLDGTDARLLRSRIREVFAAARAARERPADDGVPPGRSVTRDLIVLSPLAEGADRLVAEEALAAGLALYCPLPFDRDTYTADFPTASSRAEYDALLAAATRIIELAGSRESPAATGAAYAAVGAWVLDHSDVLLAVWDGTAPRGQGGTGHVVRDALARHVPVVWIHARPPHDVRLLSTARDGSLVSEALAGLTTRLAAGGPPR